MYYKNKILEKESAYLAKNGKITWGSWVFNVILSIILVGFSVSIIDFFLSRLVIFIITVALLLALVVKRKRVNAIVYFITAYFVLIQLLAMLNFNDLTQDSLLSLGLTVTRFLLAFLIIKHGGMFFLERFEKFSFTLILVGLPLFVIIQYIPQVSSFLSSFDINSIKIQQEYGGWNIFFFVHSGWAGNRFSGYAWEPGGMAMMITISWVIYILNKGPLINLKVLIYCLAMILTFSTTGYIVMLFLAIFYAINRRGTKLFAFGFPIFVAVLIAAPYIWKLDFMERKINNYIENDEKYRSYEGSYESLEVKNVGRWSIIKIGLNDIVKWPLGYGTVIAGRTKNVKGEVISGANGLINFLLLWGFIGLAFLIYALYKFVCNFRYSKFVRFKLFLLVALLLVFSSNQVSLNPILYFIILYPFVYKYDKLRNQKIIANGNSINRINAIPSS
ncbi:MAG: hypothetical protein JXB49_14545 [Bacteroidales bacterium]|nr:hypothetical protein [Bacteroidales bacterium]